MRHAADMNGEALPVASHSAANGALHAAQTGCSSMQGQWSSNSVHPGYKLEHVWLSDGLAWMVKVDLWPATARTEPQPSTLLRAGAARDCTQASPCHRPVKVVPPENRQLP